MVVFVTCLLARSGRSPYQDACVSIAMFRAREELSRDWSAGVLIWNRRELLK
jgi:hypothetical protein